MKIRLGHVGNSSSSSFITIGSAKSLELPKAASEGIYEVGTAGETCFGWGPDTIVDVDSRITFAYLQTFYVEDNIRERWRVMLDKALEETMPQCRVLLNDLASKHATDDAYIDHQSNAEEGANTEMFDSAENLCDFLFNSSSSITLDNDNH